MRSIFQTLKVEKLVTVYCICSTLSSGLNAMSALFLEDIVVKIKPGISDRMGTLVAKLAGKFLHCVH